MYPSGRVPAMWKCDSELVFRLQIREPHHLITISKGPDHAMRCVTCEIVLMCGMVARIIGTNEPTIEDNSGPQSFNARRIRSKTGIWNCNGLVLYNLLILANSLIAFQGFVFTVVYFTLQWLGRPQRMDFIRRWSIKRKAAATGDQLTVPEIRSNAERKIKNQVLNQHTKTMKVR